MTNWEQGLIGTVIDNPSAASEAIIVAPADFEVPQHRTIWIVTTELAKRGTLTKLTLIEGLRAIDQLDSLGGETSRGEGYIDELISRSDLAGLTEYIEQVREQSVKRRLTDMGRVLVDQSRNGMPSTEIIEAHVKKLLSLKAGTDKAKLIEASMPEFEKRQADLKSGAIKPYWYPNLEALEELYGHMTDVDFQLVVGLPGTGKSAYIIYEAVMTAARGQKVLLFTFENSAEEVIIRAVSHFSKVNNQVIYDPTKRTRKEDELVASAYEQVRALPLYIVEAHFSSSNDVIAQARRAKLQHPDLALIGVDGIYLMAGNSRDMNKYEIISENTQAMRSMAMELHVPVLGTTQFNRGAARSRKDPELDDLLYGGENAARKVMTITKTPMEERDMRLFPENLKNGKLIIAKSMPAVVVNFKVLKNTDGPVGRSADVAWIKSTNSFRTLTENWKEDARLVTPRAGVGYSKERQVHAGEA